MGNSNIKQASIGQSIVHAVRPRSTVPPILFGLGVELDHMFGSRWLLSRLNRLGMCSSPWEVLRYKQSVIANEDVNDYIKCTMPGSFSQWSADNVDHNVRTLDGKGTLHGMGVIVSSTGLPDQNTRMFDLPAVPREKRKLAAAAAFFFFRSGGEAAVTQG